MAENKDPYKLTSIDDQGSRINIIPAEVRGKLRRWRSRVHIVLLLILLILPWLKVGGHQAVLLNIANQEFNFFGILFRTHDAPLIFFVLASLVMGLAFVTAIWGRIWCGWACPQTVFIDSVFRRIEYWIEGNYLERRKLQNAPWNTLKITKFSAKWITFLIVSSALAHTLIAYFAGAEELLQMMRNPPTENWRYFLTVSFLTIVVLFDFAWFREQFCVIMCPYGRIQSVLLEPNSLSVVYNSARGEPRRNVRNHNGQQGDCVSCNRCVEVCPTGIDIRNGLQMECISCSACIDACDEIMAKVKKPQGLIAYSTLDGSGIQILKPKTAFYALTILFSTTALAYNLMTREPLNIALLRAKETPYTTSKNNDGTPLIQNHFRLRLTNQTAQDSGYHIGLVPESAGAGLQLTVGQNPFILKAKSSETIHVFVHLPQSHLPASGQLLFGLQISAASGEGFQRELTFLGPRR